jgi:nucleolar GTP-binding protein
MFERLPTVPRSQELLDKAFRRASKTKGPSMVNAAGSILSDKLANLIRSFPSFESLPPFYRELTDVIVGIDKLRISLSRLDWASREIKIIVREYSGRMRMGEDPALRRAAFGRISSVMRSIEKDLLFLGEARDKLRKLPTIDPELPTILIAGYPNVGKSSFIVRITVARPEIASYPFTTQGIYVGHFTRGRKRYQVVDTPGLLDRPLSEKNEIERQSLAALRHLKGVVLFIMDPSGHCGYPLDAQIRLVEELKSWIELPMLVVANKSDLAQSAGLPRMSTLTGEGVPEVLDELIAILGSKSSA